LKLKTFQNENFKKGKAIIEIKTKNIKIIEGKVDNLLLLKILKIQNRKKNTNIIFKSASLKVEIL